MKKITLLKNINMIIKNKQGLTLVEVVVGFLIFTILFMGVSAVLVPTLNTYAKANDMAELTTLMNTASAEITNDLSQSVRNAEISGSGNDEIKIYVGGNVIDYRVTTGGIIERSFNGNTPAPIFDERYYKGKSVDMSFQVDYADPPAGEPTYTLNMKISNDRAGTLKSEFVVRPLILNQ